MSLCILPSLSSRGISRFVQILTVFVAVTGAVVNVTGSVPNRIKLGMQAFTFRDRTFLEMLEATEKLEVRLLQAYPGQRLSPTRDTVFHHDMSTADQAWVRQALVAHDITLVSYGQVTGRNEAEWQQIFTFAQAMGMQDIATKPREADLALVARLAQKFNIKVSLHNHPKAGSLYSRPADALAAVQQAGGMVGLCADTGHWARLNFDPVDSLRLAAGHITSVHFKDLEEFGVRSAKDVPWGTGVSAAVRQIGELRRQHFSGIVYVEYEHLSATHDAEVARSVAFFNRAVNAPLTDLQRGHVVAPGFTFRAEQVLTAATAGPPASHPRWPSAKPLFAPDLSDAELVPGTWFWEDDVLVGQGQEDWKRGKANLWTKRVYENFVLTLEFKCPPGANGGILLRCDNIPEWLNHSFEVQILQDRADNPRGRMGALYDYAAPSANSVPAPDEWHKLQVIADGAKITVLLNDQPITKANLNEWTESGKNPDGSPNKFQRPLKDQARSGRIGFQFHGHPIVYRNLMIEEL